MTEAIIDIQDLKTYFYTDEGIVKAVDGVNLKLEQNKTLGLVGESGCGKSTVALSLMRILPWPGKTVGGKIIFNGQNLLDLSDDEMRKIRGKEISMIFQDPTASLNPVFDIEDQLGEVVKLHQNIGEKEQIRSRLIDMLQNVGISDGKTRLSNYPHEFSGGMKQRIMIAMALLCQPKLLIADEPTTSLDVTIQAQILELMKELKQILGSSVLLITHNLGIVAELTDLTAVMYAGKVVEYTDTMTVFKRSIHPYTTALLESIPRVDIDQERLTSISGFVPSLYNPPPGCRFHPRCKYAKEKCTQEEPALEYVTSSHQVACHFWEEISASLSG
jgi:peptide/nickel transport system ATP-binding protein